MDLRSIHTIGTRGAAAIAGALARTPNLQQHLAETGRNTSAAHSTAKTPRETQNLRSDTSSQVSHTVRSIKSL